MTRCALFFPFAREEFEELLALRHHPAMMVSTQTTVYEKETNHCTGGVPVTSTPSA